MRKIKLQNRYGLALFLEEIEPCRWKLTGESPAYISVIGAENDIKAIDPEGGPFIGIGYPIDDEQVTGVTFEQGVGYIFRTK